MYLNKIIKKIIKKSNLFKYHFKKLMKLKQIILKINKK